jgi:hypothetical protein
VGFTDCAAGTGGVRGRSGGSGIYIGGPGSEGLQGGRLLVHEGQGAACRPRDTQGPALRASALGTPYGSPQGTGELR